METDISSGPADSMTAARHVFRGHWSLFLPTVVVAALYLGGWFAMTVLGKGDGEIAKLLLVIGVAAPPMLFAHALFRFKTIRLSVYAEGISFRTGPSKHDRTIGANKIAAIRLRRGLAGRIFDVGTLLIFDNAGRLVVLRDVANPRQAAASLDALINQCG